MSYICEFCRHIGSLVAPHYGLNPTFIATAGKNQISGVQFLYDLIGMACAAAACVALFSILWRFTFGWPRFENHWSPYTSKPVRWFRSMNARTKRTMLRRGFNVAVVPEGIVLQPKAFFCRPVLIPWADVALEKDRPTPEACRSFAYPAKVVQLAIAKPFPVGVFLSSNVLAAIASFRDPLSLWRPGNVVDDGAS